MSANILDPSLSLFFSLSLSLSLSLFFPFLSLCIYIQKPFFIKTLTSLAFVRPLHLCSTRFSRHVDTEGNGRKQSHGRGAFLHPQCPTDTSSGESILHHHLHCSFTHRSRNGSSPSWRDRWTSSSSPAACAATRSPWTPFGKWSVMGWLHETIIALSNFMFSDNFKSHFLYVDENTNPPPYTSE